MGNLCALLSQMGKHQEALQHAEVALTLLLGDDQPKSSSSLDGCASGESLVCVAYFNMGAEFEHLKRASEALWAYDHAHKTSIQELGEEHPLSQQITACLAELKAKTKNKKKG